VAVELLSRDGWLAVHPELTDMEQAQNRALQYLKSAAEAGDKVALYLVGGVRSVNQMLSSRSVDVNIDFAETIVPVLEEIEKGDNLEPDLLFFVACANYAQALLISCLAHQAAAIQGAQEAMKQSLAKMKQAGDAGNIPAARYYAFFGEQQQAFESPAAAFKQWVRAARMGDLQALLRVTGVMNADATPPELEILAEEKAESAGPLRACVDAIPGAREQRRDMALIELLMG
jgi:hypothetical protein